MATANTLSTAITNADASPQTTKTNPAVGAAAVRRAIGTVETVSGDNSGSVYRFARLPSNAVVYSIKKYQDTMTPSGATLRFDCGLYQTSANGGTAADADVFATLVECSGAVSATATTGLELRFEAADINGVEKRLWELLGSGSDTNREYDVCLTMKDDIFSAGTLTLDIAYAVV